MLWLRDSCKYYLTGKGKKLSFASPDHLKNSTHIVDTLKDHRAWYLTEKPFRGKWVGIISRIQGAGGRRQDGGPPYINPSMLRAYESGGDCNQISYFLSIVQNLQNAAGDNHLMHMASNCLPCEW